MKNILAIFFLFASLTAFGQAQSDASLSTQSTDEIKNKALNQTRLDNFNQDLIQSKSSNVPTDNTQTGSYTLALSDIGKTVIMNVGSANDLTVPPNGTVAFPVGTMIVCFQNGAGTTTVQPGSGVTINNTAGNFDAPAQYAPFVLHKTATNTWTLSNGLPGGGGGSVSSVFGRTGAVVAVAGDYEASEVTNTPAGSIAADDVQEAINELDTEKQPLDTDLTTIAGLTATTDNIIQSVGSAWASRTPTQVKTALSLNNVENTALSTWAGTTNITNVGTLTAGSTGTGFTIDFTNATESGILGVANGGTGSATAPWWPITGNTTLTGSVDINASSSNLLRFNFDNLGTTQTDGAGLGLVNGTAAAAGAQQISPSINFRGHGWKTNATAATQPVEFKIYNLPVQGAAAPTGNLTIAQSINDAANTTLLTIGTDGLFTLTSATSGNGATFRTGANLYIRHNEVGSIFFGNTSNARIGSAAAGTFGVTSGSLAYGADTDHYFSTATVSNITLASSNKYQFSGSFSGTSGTNNGKFYRLVPTYNITGGTIPVYDFIIESTETSFSGPHYGIVNTSTTALNGLGTSTPTERLDVNGNGKFAGNVTLSTAGNKLFIKEGTNASMGNAVLVGGTVTVNTTAVTASSEIFLTHKVAGGTLGVVSVGTVTAATSFVINSSSGTDTSTISWIIIEPAP